MKRQILMFAAALSLSASCLCTGEVSADYETSLSRAASSRQLAEQETMGLFVDAHFCRVPGSLLSSL